MIKLFFKIFSFLDKKKKIHFNLIIFFAIITSFLEMVGVAAVLPIVKIVLGNFDFSNIFLIKYLENTIGLKLSNIELITTILIVIFSFFVLKAVIIFFTESFKLSFLKNVQDNLSSILYTNYIYIDYQKLSEFKLSEKLRNIGQIGFIITFLQSCYIILADTILFLFIFSFLLSFDFKITLILVSTLLFVATIMIILSKNKLIFYSKVRTKTAAVSMENLINVLRSLKEVVILNRRSIFKDQFDHTISTFTKYERKNNLLRFFPKIAYEVIAILLIIVVILFFINQEKNLINSLEIISIFFVALLKLIPSFNKLVVNFQNLNGSYFPANEVLNELFLVGKNNLENNNFIEIKEKNNSFEKLKIENLSFNYYGQKDIILNDINLEINKGNIIGFYGPSGGGKSTMTNLLLGFLKPCKGKITVNNSNIENDLIGWHRMISYVPQDIFLFNDTIKKNILFGLDEKKINKIFFEKILEISNLNEFLKKTPNGLNTIVGENAMKLSGGQGQRICIARSLVKDPEIIVLDEATSKLDEKNEFDILKKLTTKLKKEQTLIIISHRYNTLKTFSDKVYKVFDKQIKLDYEK